MNKKAARYSGRQLLRAAQLEALREWNEDDTRPAWDRDGRAVAAVVGYPEGPLYYRARGKAPSKGSRTRLPLKTLKGLNRLRKLPANADGPVERVLRQIRVEPMRAVLAALEAEDKSDDRLTTIIDIVDGLPSPGVKREDILNGLRAFLGREPSTREAALASILCGSRVVEPRDRIMMTVADAIEKERRAMFRRLHG